MTRKPQFKIARRAVLDLEEIWQFTAEKWSVEQADRYYKLLIGEFAHIRSNPNGGKSMAHLRMGYRATKVKSHLIFYRVVNDTVEIIRILHERMDIDARLGS